jgi:hypothetical protein
LIHLLAEHAPHVPAGHVEHVDHHASGTRQIEADLGAWVEGVGDRLDVEVLRCDRTVDIGGEDRMPDDEARRSPEPSPESSRPIRSPIRTPFSSVQEHPDPDLDTTTSGSRTSSWDRCCPVDLPTRGKDMARLLELSWPRTPAERFHRRGWCTNGPHPERRNGGHPVGWPLLRVRTWISIACSRVEGRVASRLAPDPTL